MMSANGGPVSDSGAKIEDIKMDDVKEPAPEPETEKANGEVVAPVEEPKEGMSSSISLSLHRC